MLLALLLAAYRHSGQTPLIDGFVSFETIQAALPGWLAFRGELPDTIWVQVVAQGWFDCAGRALRAYPAPLTMTAVKLA
ncbi:MAG: hypothetical protein WAL71_03310 [Terriglobales bacterium]